MIKYIIFLYFIFIPLNIFSSYSIPKPIENYTKKNIHDDQTNAIQISIIGGTNLIYWNNEESVVSDFETSRNTYYLGMNFDKYFIFFKAFTSSLYIEYLKNENDNYEFNNIYLSAGYKLQLYSVFNLKIEGKSSVYKYFDFGSSVSIGFEWEFINKFIFYMYPAFDMMFLNFKNRTLININFFSGISYYF